MPFLEQMANIDSEVARALNWKAKNNVVYCRQAAERAIELMDLTLASIKGYPRLKEIARAREVMIDYFFGANEYASTEISLKKYFSSFTDAARRHD